METREERKSSAEVVNTDSGGNDQMFAACVMEFGLVLRKSEYKGEASLAQVLVRLNTLSEYLEGDIYKSEFKTLVEKALASELYE